MLPFASEIGLERWRAETRGSNISIISSLSTFESLAGQRVHEQLRHELLHLWVPNGLNLEGDYAWFYEGFAVYQSLKSGVWLGQIRFDDYLNTLSAAFDIDYRRKALRPLIDVSNARWNNPDSRVYARGMLVGFLSDIALLTESNGKRDLADVFREILKRHNRSMPRREASSAIVSVLMDYPELIPIVNRYIKSGGKINGANYLASIGIESVGKLPPLRLKLKNGLNGRQKALLRKLGYNRWRKLLRKSK
jgi:predicted metalloprotease with PDZ domain